MKFLIGLALILMGIFVEANPPNLDDDNIQGLKIANQKLEETIKSLTSRIKNIEVGVRLIDEEGGTNKEYIGFAPYRKGPANVKYVKKRVLRGRIEVFQLGGWQKLCMKDKTGDKWKGLVEKWRLASAACQMLGWEISGIPTATFDKRLEESGVSKYNYNCKKGDEKSIFECDREEKESECDADGKTDWATARCTKSLE